MEHSTLLKEIMTLLDEDDVKQIYYGVSPLELELNNDQLIVATNLMCAFIEQEVNWGVYNFQLHTNFGSTEFNKHKCEYLERAVPRDYFLFSHTILVRPDETKAEREARLNH